MAYLRMIHTQVIQWYSREKVIPHAIPPRISLDPVPLGSVVCSLWQAPPVSSLDDDMCSVCREKNQEDSVRIMCDRWCKSLEVISIGLCISSNNIVWFIVPYDLTYLMFYGTDKSVLAVTDYILLYLCRYSSTVRYIGLIIHALCVW